MDRHGGKLRGKVAIVTGAASGIGEAIAALYLNEGACVVVSDLPGRGLPQRFLNQPHVRAVEIDVTAEEAPARLVGTATREFGGLDVLVNNAGIALGKPFEETTDDEFDRIMNVNVRSVFRVTREAVPHLKLRGGGSVINLASIMSGTGGPQLAAYATSKHAVLGLSRPFFDDPGFRQSWETKAPLGRIGDPVDVAVVALFLATDDARFVSGAGIAIDGAAGVNF